MVMLYFSFFSISQLNAERDELFLFWCLINISNKIIYCTERSYGVSSKIRSSFMSLFDQILIIQQ